MKPTLPVALLLLLLPALAFAQNPFGERAPLPGFVPPPSSVNLQPETPKSIPGPGQEGGSLAPKLDGGSKPAPKEEGKKPEAPALPADPLAKLKVQYVAAIKGAAKPEVVHNKFLEEMRNLRANAAIKGQAALEKTVGSEIDVIYAAVIKLGIARTRWNMNDGYRIAFGSNGNCQVVRPGEKWPSKEGSDKYGVLHENRISVSRSSAVITFDNSFKTASVEQKLDNGMTRNFTMTLVGKW